MIEIINHIFGTCGENHTNLLNLSGIGLGISGYLSYIILIIKTKFKLWKNNNLI
jgi:hypothetical protein